MHVDYLSSQDLEKCPHNATVQLRSVNLMHKFQRLTYGIAFVLKYSFSAFIEGIFRMLNSNVLMFSVSQYIQQLVFDVNKMHVATHGQRTAVISDLTEVGAIPVNVANVGDIKFMKFGSVLVFFT